MRCADKHNTPFIPHVETQDVQHSHVSELMGCILLSICPEVLHVLCSTFQSLSNTSRDHMCTQQDSTAGYEKQSPPKCITF